MFFHCFDRTCHLRLAKAAVLTFQREAERETLKTSGGTRCKESPTVLCMCCTLLHFSWVCILLTGSCENFWYHICYFVINWLDCTMDLYIHAAERKKNKDVAPKACNETLNSWNDRKKGNTFLCTWQTALQSITYPLTAWHSLPVMVVVRTGVPTLSFRSSHSIDKGICWLPVHACKPERFWTPYWRALPIFSQTLHRCSVLQKTGAASSRPCRQHGHAFSAPDVRSSNGSARINCLVPGALISAFNFLNQSSASVFL